MSSFQRQLNLYGFRRITKGKDTGAYFHPNFRGDSHFKDLSNQVRLRMSPKYFNSGVQNEAEASMESGKELKMEEDTGNIYNYSVCASIPADCLFTDDIESVMPSADGERVEESLAIYTPHSDNVLFGSSSLVFQKFDFQGRHLMRLSPQLKEKTNVGNESCKRKFEEEDTFSGCTPSIICGDSRQQPDIFGHPVRDISLSHVLFQHPMELTTSYSNELPQFSRKDGNCATSCDRSEIDIDRDIALCFGVTTLKPEDFIERTISV